MLKSARQHQVRVKPVPDRVGRRAPARAPSRLWSWAEVRSVPLASQPTRRSPKTPQRILLAATLLLLETGEGRESTNGGGRVPRIVPCSPEQRTVLRNQAEDAAWCHCSSGVSTLNLLVLSCSMDRRRGIVH